MARSDTRYSIYPAPKAIEILGNTAPALNQAIECWAAQIARATADNAKKFWNFSAAVFGFGVEVEQAYAIKEWCVLAEALRNRQFDPEYANPGELVATAVEDANRLENVGEKWFEMELPEESFSRSELTDKSVAEVAKKLRELKYEGAWAIILAVRWLWEHKDEGIDIRKDQWWTLAFRRQWKERQSAKKEPVGATEKRKKAKQKTAETTK